VKENSFRTRPDQKGIFFDARGLQMPAVKVVASIMCADLGNLAGAVGALDRAGIDGFHVDIMDGVFAPNIVMGPPFVAALRPLTRLPFEAHLMVRDPMPLIPALADGGCDVCLVHAESAVDLAAAVDAVVRAGMRAGVAINPTTPVSRLAPVVSALAQVVVMAVEPGFAGRPMVPGTAERVAQAAEVLRSTGAPVPIEVDGNINPRTVPPLVAAGARILVGGSTGLFLRDVPFGTALARLRAAAGSQPDVAQG